MVWELVSVVRKVIKIKCRFTDSRNIAPFLYSVWGGDADATLTASLPTKIFAAGKPKNGSLFLEAEVPRH